MLRAHALVADALVVDCSKGLSLQFYVESVATELYIDISGYLADNNAFLYDGAGLSIKIVSLLSEVQESPSLSTRKISSIMMPVPLFTTSRATIHRLQ